MSGTHPREHRKLGARRDAFTLLELLLVIAIIPLLASLLLPALAQAKDRARNAKCQSNEKQWALALRMYIDDWACYPFEIMSTSGRFPAMGGDALVSAEFQLDSYISPNRALARASCPQPYPVKAILRGFTGPYIYNNFARTLMPILPYLGLGGDLNKGVPLREPGVVAPSHMIAFCEFAVVPSKLFINDTQIFDGRYPWTGEEVYRHTTGENMAYCDGHVARMSKRMVATRTEELRRRWFNDNLPHPEIWP